MTVHKTDGPTARPARQTLASAMALMVCLAAAAQRDRQTEALDRGLVAVSTGNGVYIGWRHVITDPPGLGFRAYRHRGGQRTLLNPVPRAGGTNLADADGRPGDHYSVEPVPPGDRHPPNTPVSVWPEQYLEIPLSVPPNGTTADGHTVTHAPNDASVGDLDGDGRYDLVLKWSPSRTSDNARAGHTGTTLLEGLTLEGTSLWRIDLGPNIRSGAHYLPFSVFDFDGDGRAEIICRTGDGTVDGVGTVLGHPEARHANDQGWILAGPEYLTVFSGSDGRALHTVPYEPARGDFRDWGDNYGNRVDRFLDCVAYLDGTRPSLITCRGYYGGRNGKSKNAWAAWDVRDGKLRQRWLFVATHEQNADYIGQGAHSITAGDVDGDGRDEILYGASAIDDDGTGLYSTGFGHGDAHHLGDLDPSRPGLECFMPHESKSAPGVSFRDAGTGEIIWQHPMNRDVGRGVAADILAQFPGAECWAASGMGLYDCNGTTIGPRPGSINFVVWWDADPQRELLDANWIAKYQFPGGELKRLLTAEGCTSNNGTKSTPCLSADLLGDWREEVVWRTTDNRALRLYTTVIPTEMAWLTPMQDPVYRLSVAAQNAGYNQPPHASMMPSGGPGRP